LRDTLALRKTRAIIRASPGREGGREGGSGTDFSLRGARFRSKMERDQGTRPRATARGGGSLMDNESR